MASSLIQPGPGVQLTQPQLPQLPQFAIHPDLRDPDGKPVKIVPPFFQGGDRRQSWYPNPGMQMELCKRLEFELGVFGGKYGGKSEGSRFWMATGNPHKPLVDPNGVIIPWNLSYFYHPGFRGLILRKNQDDLADYISKATQRWKHMGVQFLNGEFRLPMGGVIDVGHLANAASWQKYIGVEFTRIIVEEAALIPDEDSYEQLMSCCRSIYPELRAQILLTSNAGGPGTPWLIERFMEPVDNEGNVIEPGNTIFFEVPDPFTGEKRYLTRVFVFSTIQDNPEGMADPQYRIVLASIKDEKMRQAYVYGNWRAFQGTYFDIFRPRGPASHEPKNANHVIPAKSTLIEPWWPHMIGVDWGRTHEASAIFAAQNPITQQVYLFDELVVEQTSPVQFGFQIADRLWHHLISRLPDSMRQNPPSVPMALSPDAWQNRTGDKTIAELIAKGINRRLGEGAAFNAEGVIEQLKDAYELGDVARPVSKEQMDGIMEKIRRSKQGAIKILKAEDARVTGWTICIESLRWQDVGIPTMAGFDQQLASKIMIQSGLEAYLQYCQLFKDQDSYVSDIRLPQLQIWGPSVLDMSKVEKGGAGVGEWVLKPMEAGGRGGCPRLIQAIPRAIHSETNPEDVDKKHFKGMDSLDSWRYLMMLVQEVQNWEPREIWMSKQLEELKRRNGGNVDVRSLIAFNYEIEREWKEKEEDMMKVLNGGLGRNLASRRLTLDRVHRMIG